MQSKKQNKKRMAVLWGIALIGLSLVLWKYAGTPLIQFISDPASFRQWVDSHGWYSRLVYIGMVIFQVIIAIIPGEPFEIAAGYAIGAVEGTILAIAGAAIGSIITFWLVRLWGMKLIRVFFSDEQINSVRFLKTSERRDFLFLIIYMIPGTPKDLLGYFAGVTDIRFPVFFLMCTLGRIPSVITSTVGGDALGTQSYTMAAIVFVVTLAISAIGLLVYQQICKHKSDASSKGGSL